MGRSIGSKPSMAEIKDQVAESMLLFVVANTKNKQTKLAGASGVANQVSRGPKGAPARSLAINGRVHGDEDDDWDERGCFSCSSLARASVSSHEYTHMKWVQIRVNRAK